MFNSVFGYHPITGEIVNIWYTSISGDRYRVIGIAGKWMVCNESDDMKWITKEMYDSYHDAIRVHP